MSGVITDNGLDVTEEWIAFMFKFKGFNTGFVFDNGVVRSICNKINESHAYIFFKPLTDLDTTGTLIADGLSLSRIPRFFLASSNR